MNQQMNHPEGVAAAALADLSGHHIILDDEDDGEETRQGKGASSLETNKPSNAATSSLTVPPAEALTIQYVKKPRTFVDHSYKDYSRVPVMPEDTTPSKIQDMTFNQKVHHILSQEHFSHCIRWMPHGRAFLISVPLAFERQVCETYFGHRRYSSFLRELKDHGYKQITVGNDRNCYYQECMLKGMPHLTKFMPAKRNIRRQNPDPESEPDFYQITTAHPLACDPDYNTYKDKVKARMASQVAHDTSLEPPTKKQAVFKALNESTAPRIPTVASSFQANARVNGGSTGTNLLQEMSTLMTINNNLLAAQALKSAMNLPATSPPTHCQNQNAIFCELLKRLQNQC